MVRSADDARRQDRRHHRLRSWQDRRDRHQVDQHLQGRLRRAEVGDRRPASEVEVSFRVAVVVPAR